MALIYCPECRKEISDTSDSCPHCGFKIKKYLKKHILCESCGRFYPKVDEFCKSCNPHRLTTFQKLMRFFALLIAVPLFLLMLFNDEKSSSGVKLQPTVNAGPNPSIKAAEIQPQSYRTFTESDFSFDSKTRPYKDIIVKGVNKYLLLC